MLRALNQKFEKFLFWSTALATCIFFVVVCLNVFARFILNAPILGSVELSRLSFVWATFLAAALCYRQKAHIAITFVIDKLPSKIERLVLQVIYAITLVFFLVLLFYAIEVSIALRGTSFPVMQLTQTWLYLPVVVLSVFIISFTAEELLDLITVNKL